MSPDFDTELLRLFIKYNIPPLPAAVEERREQYTRESQELTRRAGLARNHPDFLSKDGFDKKSAKLLESARDDIDRIIGDPASYQDWRATGEDWRTLSLAQACRSDPKTFGFEEDFPTSGDDHYFYESVISRIGCENPGTTQTWVTKKAAEIINKAIQTGDYTPQSGNRGKRVEASYLNSFWTSRKPSIRARWEGYLKSIEDNSEPDDYSPSYMKRRRFLLTQFRNLEAAAKRISLRHDSEIRMIAPWIFPVLSDFAAWREETADAPALPAHIQNWDQWRGWRRTLARSDIEVERALYRKWAEVRRSRH